jgi:hypothetical protein
MNESNLHHTIATALSTPFFRRPCCHFIETHRSGQNRERKVVELEALEFQSDFISVPQRQDFSLLAHSHIFHAPHLTPRQLVHHSKYTPSSTTNPICNRQDGSPPLERQGYLLLRHPLLPPGPHLVQIDPRQRRRANLQTRSQGRHPVANRCCVEG